eukprot:Amastigsp_a345317_263.p3 type:complete len:195 gc:universal Amastigsp_a345317_263:353-937(+)
MARRRHTSALRLRSRTRTLCTRSTARAACSSGAGSRSTRPWPSATRPSTIWARGGRCPSTTALVRRTSKRSRRRCQRKSRRRPARRTRSSAPARTPCALCTLVTALRRRATSTRRSTLRRRLTRRACSFAATTGTRSARRHGASTVATASGRGASATESPRFGSTATTSLPCMRPSRARAQTPWPSRGRSSSRR